MNHSVAAPAVISIAALAAALSCTAAQAAPAVATSVRGAPAKPDSLFQQLEEEKANYNIYKAYFPSLEIARKAAISFHGQLLESNYGGGYLILELEAGDMERLRPFGFRFEQATEFIQRRNAALTRAQQVQSQRGEGQQPQSIPGYSCYETVEETFAAGDTMIAAQPTLASWVNAGPSWQKTQGSGGYDMRVLKLTNSAIVPAGGAAKPKLFINSAIHAREYTTAPLVLEFARWLVNGYGVDADATWMLDHQEIHLMLQSNPDGRKKAEAGLSWRKNTNNAYCANTNTRGVDLNRNFGFTWNSTNGQGSSGTACNLTYRGPSASSEPETQAIESYIRSIWPDQRGPGMNDAAPATTMGLHLDIHSYSQLVLWPWGETATPAPNATAMQTLGRRLAFFNGYTPQQSIGLYPTDGTSDGPSYGELGIPSITIELGSAFFESCSSYTSTTKPANLPALIYAARVARAPYLLPAGPDITAVTLAGDASGNGVIAGTVVALSGSATDTRFNNSNGTEATQAIAAAEYTIDTPPWDGGAAPKPLTAADGSFNTTTEALAGSIGTLGLALGKHTVFVRAKDASGAWGPVSATFLNVSSTPLPLPEMEPNDAPATAQPINSFPTLIAGTMDTTSTTARSDTDYYLALVQPGKTLTATLTPNASSAYSLQIFDIHGRSPLATSDAGTGLAGVASVRNSGSSAQSVYVRVTYGSGLKGPNATYALSFTQ